MRASIPMQARRSSTTPRLTALAMTLVTGLAVAGCGGKKAAAPADDGRGAAVGILGGAAADAGIDERYLMTAAYVQSHFGQDAKSPLLALPDSSRSPVFGLEAKDLGGAAPSDLAANARALADKIALLARDKKPASDFDWLLVTAQAIVGDKEADPNLRDFTVRLVLLELIDAHNEGFSALLAHGERAIVEPAGEARFIDFKRLDQGQLRHVNSFQFTSDAVSDAIIPGRPEARADRPKSDALPKVIVRLCPSGTLRCFDHLRKSEKASAHFMSYRARNGRREVVQFHDTKKDLKRYDAIEANTVSLVVSAVSGAEKGTLRPDVLDWEDYVALRQTVLEIVARTGREAQRPDMEAKMGDAGFVDGQVIEALEGSPAAGAPANMPSFALPVVWDSALFRELLRTGGVLRDASRIRIESPRDAQGVGGTEVYFSFYPDPEGAKYQVYTDAPRPAPGQPWELIMAQPISPGQARYDQPFTFREKGLNGNTFRAAKIVSRRADGTLLGTRIVRFSVLGIPRE